MSNKFGKLLRKYRNDSKLRLLDVAQKMSWSVVYLADIEKGRRNPPDENKIFQLAAILNKDPYSLMEALYQDNEKIELILTDANIKLGFALARNWCNLLPETTEKIIKILNNTNYEK